MYNLTLRNIKINNSYHESFENLRSTIKCLDGKTIGNGVSSCIKKFAKGYHLSFNNRVERINSEYNINKTNYNKWFLFKNNIIIYSSVYNFKDFEEWINNNKFSFIPRNGITPIILFDEPKLKLLKDKYFNLKTNCDCIFRKTHLIDNINIYSDNGVFNSTHSSLKNCYFKSKNYIEIIRGCLEGEILICDNFMEIGDVQYNSFFKNAFSIYTDEIIYSHDEHDEFVNNENLEIYYQIRNSKPEFLRLKYLRFSGIKITIFNIGL